MKLTQSATFYLADTPIVDFLNEFGCITLTEEEKVFAWFPFPVMILEGRQGLVLPAAADLPKPVKEFWDKTMSQLKEKMKGG